MPEIIILQGLQFSSRSKLATEILFDDKDSVRLSKTDIREMIHKGLEWSGSRDSLAVSVEAKMIGMFLDMGKNVIIDNINLNPNHIATYRKIANVFNSQVRIIKSESSTQECIRNNLEDENGISPDYILNLANKYRLEKTTNQYAIFALDQCIANTRDRMDLSRDAHESIIEDIYHDPSNIAMDKPNKSIIDLIYQWRQDCGIDIVIVDARPDNCRQATEEWLIEAGVPYDRLILRDNNIDIPWEFKQYALNKYLDKEKCCMAIDSDIAALEMYGEDNGLPTFDALRDDISILMAK
jgi:predicted kinase